MKKKSYYIPERDGVALVHMWARMPAQAWRVLRNRYKVATGKSPSVKDLKGIGWRVTRHDSLPVPPRKLTLWERFICWLRSL
jgi:hypothetical protein